MNFREVALRLLENPEAHARFVNTLSMLEYIGARKILKSQAAESMSMQILGHAAEEIRHAQILKGLAMQLNKELTNYADEHLLCAQGARTYFQALDQACAALLPSRDPKKNYALTTLLIEERAMKIYPEYERLLKERNIPNALKAIIKDEDKHLSEMQYELLQGTLLENRALADLRALEEKLFTKFMRDLYLEAKRAYKLPSHSPRKLCIEKSVDRKTSWK